MNANKLNFTGTAYSNVSFPNVTFYSIQSGDNFLETSSVFDDYSGYFVSKIYPTQDIEISLTNDDYVNTLENNGGNNEDDSDQLDNVFGESTYLVSLNLSNSASFQLDTYGSLSVITLSSLNDNVNYTVALSYNISGTVVEFESYTRNKLYSKFWLFLSIM